MSDLIRIEFWNGHLSKSKKSKVNFWSTPMPHVISKHNPCLWSNFDMETKPWRRVYIQALEAINDWERGKLSANEFLHHLRYIAYGIGKRDFDDVEVVWPGNLTINHKPKLVVSTQKEQFIIDFYNEDEEWKAIKTIVQSAKFYWEL
jgi:hypothetical protein